MSNFLRMFRKRKAKAAATPAEPIPAVSPEMLHAATLLAVQAKLATNEPGLTWMRFAEQLIADRFGAEMAPSLLGRAVAACHFCLMNPRSPWIHSNIQETHIAQEMWRAMAVAPLDATRRFNPRALEALAAMESESATNAATIQ